MATCCLALLASDQVTSWALGQLLVCKMWIPHLSEITQAHACAIHVLGIYEQIRYKHTHQFPHTHDPSQKTESTFSVTADQGAPRTVRDPHAGPCWGVGTVPTVSSPSYSRRARSLAGSGRGGRGSRGDSLQPGRRQDCPRRTPWGDHADTGQKTTLGHPEGDCDPRVAMCGRTAERTPATSQEASTKGSLVRT